MTLKLRRNPTKYIGCIVVVVVVARYIWNTEIANLFCLMFWSTSMFLIQNQLSVFIEQIPFEIGIYKLYNFQVFK